MTKLKILSDKSIQKLMECSDSIAIKYNSSNEWLDDFFQENNLENESVLPIEMEFELPELKSDINNNRNEEDFENSVRLYEALKNLQPYQAIDQRMWVWMTHYYYSDYMYKRWLAECPDEKRQGRLILRYFCPPQGKSLSRNGLLRLWWSAYFTVDDSINKDSERYRYTRKLWKEQDLFDYLVAHKFVRHKPLLFTLIDLLRDEENFPLFKDRQNRRDFVKTLNLYSGHKCYSTFQYDDLYPIIKKRAEIFADKKYSK